MKVKNELVFSKKGENSIGIGRGMTLVALLFLIAIHAMGQPSMNSDGAYKISSIEDVNWICDHASESNTYILTSNIDLGNFKGIGTSAAPFKGVFDGNGKTVTVAISSTDAVRGLFNYVNGATIRNLFVKGSISAAPGANDAICGIVGKVIGAKSYFDCIVSNVNISAKAEQGKISYSAGLVAFSEVEFSVSNSLANGEVTGFAEWGAKPTIGGFVGKSEKKVDVSNSLMCGTLKSSKDKWNSTASPLVADGNITSTNNYLYDIKVYNNSGSTNDNDIIYQSLGGTSVIGGSELSTSAFCSTLNNGQSPAVWTLDHNIAEFAGIPLPVGGMKVLEPRNQDYLKLTFGENLAEDLEISDCSCIIANTLELEYTFSDNNWHPFYVPLRLPYESWKDQFEVAKILNFHDYNKGEKRIVVLEIQRVTAGVLKENHPYLLRAKTPSAEPQSIILDETFAEAYRTMYQPKDGNKITCATTENIYTFIGNYKRNKQIATDDYVLSDGVLTVDAMQANKGVVNPCQWYMTVTSRSTDSSDKEYYAPKRIALSLDGFDASMFINDTEDIATAIEECESDSATPVAYYSVSGVKYDEAQPGLNIVKMSNGATKKIWVK